MQVTNKYILKTQHKALAIWKDKSKSWYHFTFTKMIKITVVAKEYKKLGPSHFLWDSLFHALLMLFTPPFYPILPISDVPTHTYMHSLGSGMYIPGEGTIPQILVEANEGKNPTNSPCGPQCGYVPMSQ